jgi:hypothetical protein
MKQIAYVLPLRKFGKGLALFFPAKFAQTFKMKEDDLGIPCQIKMTKEEMASDEKDEVLGEYHLVIKIYRLKGTGVLPYLSGDDPE